MSSPAPAPTPTSLTTPRLHLRAAHYDDLPAIHTLFKDPAVMKYWYTLFEINPFLAQLIPSALRRFRSQTDKVLIARTRRSCPPHTSLAQTRPFLCGMIASETNGRLDFVMEIDDPDCPEDKGRVIGKVGIWSAEKAEISYMLNREYWGRGYMSEAFTVLLQHCWAQGMEQVTADVDPKNEVSLGMLKKFGFVETGRKEMTGVGIDGWYDSVFLALEKPKESSKEPKEQNKVPLDRSHIR